MERPFLGNILTPGRTRWAQR